ncbi:hypothetical protein EXIGLDRAFT_833629 [Exidia glandulosa HHB12029]|uniref:Uncharacterized protein n=1 Tax=Exidia glandulosa HHB12029 TaxID=1314781 RepID=A0A165KII4_EXIGL|nr:hypothetical protein EXIGLDRAFT_833629 [Exidia glandulosa HHB12029]
MQSLQPAVLLYLADSHCDVETRACLSACNQHFRTLLAPLLFRGLSFYPGRTVDEFTWYHDNLALRYGQSVERLSFRDYKPEYSPDGGSPLTDTEDERDRKPHPLRDARDSWKDCCEVEIQARDAVYAAIVPRCSALQSVRLTVEHVFHFPNCVTALHRVHGVRELIVRPLRRPQRDRIATPAALIAGWCTLTTLRLADLHQSVPLSSCAYNVVSKLRCLTSLSIDVCDYLGDWASVAFVCPLRHLLLRRCTNITGVQLLTFLGNFTRTLESISLWMCPILPPMEDLTQAPLLFERLSYVCLANVPMSRDIMSMFAANTGTLELRLGTVLHPDPATGATRETYCVSIDAQTGGLRFLGDDPDAFCAALPQLLPEVAPYVQTVRVQLFPWHQYFPKYQRLKAALAAYALETGVTLSV